MLFNDFNIFTEDLLAYAVNAYNANDAFRSHMKLYSNLEVWYHIVFIYAKGGYTSIHPTSH